MRLPGAVASLEGLSLGGWEELPDFIVHDQWQIFHLWQKVSVAKGTLQSLHQGFFFPHVISKSLVLNPWDIPQNEPGQEQR